MRMRVALAVLMSIGVLVAPALARADTADIETTMVAGPAEVAQGEDATFQYLVSNRGPNAATGTNTKVTFSVVGSSRFEVRSLSAKNVSDGAARGACANGSTGWGCDLGTMGAGEAVLVSLTIRAGDVPGPTDLSVVGSLSTGRTDLSDPNAGRRTSNPNSNDEAVASFEIKGSPAGTPPGVAAITVKGRTVTITLSEAATLSGSISRRTSGRRRPGGPCNTKSRQGRPCAKYVKVGTYKRELPAGETSFKLPLRLSGKQLKPGTYRLRFFLTDAAGNRTKTARTLKFRIR
jgi:CARDB